MILLLMNKMKEKYKKLLLFIIQKRLKNQKNIFKNLLRKNKTFYLKDSIFNQNKSKKLMNKLNKLNKILRENDFIL